MTAVFADELPSTRELSILARQVQHWLHGLPQHPYALLPTTGISRALGNRIITVRAVGDQDRPILTISVGMCMWIERTDVWKRLLNPIDDEELRALSEHLRAAGLPHQAPQPNRHHNAVSVPLTAPCGRSLYEAERRYTQGCPAHRDPNTGRGLTEFPPDCDWLAFGLGRLVMPEGFSTSRPA